MNQDTAPPLWEGVAPDGDYVVITAEQFEDCYNICLYEKKGGGTFSQRAFEDSHSAMAWAECAVGMENVFADAMTRALWEGWDTVRYCACCNEQLLPSNVARDDGRFCKTCEDAGLTRL